MKETLSAPTAKPLTVIEPIHGWQLISLNELWQYRDLLYFFVWRNSRSVTSRLSWARRGPF
jgi:hypothetical protein